MKINFKKGLRRIVITVICLIFAISIVSYCANGCIIDKYKFSDNVYIKSLQTEKQVKLIEFAKAYIDSPSVMGWWYEDIICNPYKQKCALNEKNYIFENNKKYNLSEINNNFKKDTFFTVLMPSRIQYFFWQFFDFLLIIGISILFYSIYLLIEYVVCWIIKGFKNE